jgi:hypothetical protein
MLVLPGSGGVHLSEHCGLTISAPACRLCCWYSHPGLPATERAAQVTNFGNPFLMRVGERETLAQIKPRIQARAAQDRVSRTLS